MNTTVKKTPRCLSGSVLKMIAILTMLLDHTAFYILSEFPFCTASFLTLLGKSISLYSICRIIGRVAFPLFCFLVVEGFLYTKNREKYGLRLLIFALISELPWNFAHAGQLLYPSQNVMFTLFFGYLALCAIAYFENEKPKQLIALILLFFVCILCKADYGVHGLGLILCIYFLREKPIPQAIVGSCMLTNGWAAGLAFIPINLYNGERGFMRGAVSKYAAYLFYPAHLLILGLIRYFVF